MTYQRDKNALLRQALPLLAEQGFGGDALREAGEACGFDEDYCRRPFPLGGRDLLVHFVQGGDDKMVARLKKMPLESMKVRERITQAVLVRLACDDKHKEVVRRAVHCLALPHNVPLATKLTAETVNKMWRAVGDTSLDGNYYSKRGILGGVYVAVRLVWLGDDEGSDTEAFLDRRIQEVMRFEKTKAKWREVREGLGTPFARFVRRRFGE